MSSHIYAGLAAHIDVWAQTHPLGIVFCVNGGHMYHHRSSRTWSMLRLVVPQQSPHIWCIKSGIDEIGMFTPY
jgi:hypothetical protein